MDEPRKNLVSLRGSSAKEISRDALLEKVSQERELRNFTRRATFASLIIQKVWRRHHAIKVISLQLQQQWLTMINTFSTPLNKLQISRDVLRPFLFFRTLVSSVRKKIGSTDSECVKGCFKIVLQSIDSTNPDENFCSMVTGTNQERKLWLFQSKKLILFCLFILAEFDISSRGAQENVIVSLAMRLAVILSDRKGWKSLTMHEFQVADEAVRDLILYIGHKKSGMYSSIRKYFLKLEVPTSRDASFSSQTDDRFLITASALTLALRPFHMPDNSGIRETQHAAEGYCLYVLTIPCLAQRLPLVLLPALKHKSVLSSCFIVLQASKENFLKEASNLVQPKSYMNLFIPQAAWVLANIIYLMIASVKDGLESGKFPHDLALNSYVCVATFLAEHILAVVDNAEGFGKENLEIQADEVALVETNKTELHVLFIDFLRPVSQQHHLTGLLALEKGGMSQNVGGEFIDVCYYYSFMLRIYSALNPFLGALPILNMLSFTPGFLPKLWGSLEGVLFAENDSIESITVSLGNNMLITNKNDGFETKSARFAREGGSKWTNIFHKFTRSSLAESSKEDSTGEFGFDGNQKQISAAWDFEPLRHGPEGLSKDMYCLLHLFCATYSHLLLVLDDIEFYEKQVPFKLEQQQKIASALNFFVYNAVSCSIKPQNKPLVDSAVKCLHLLYERDCRHKFCPLALWLSPGKRNRPTIAVAARTHEQLSSTLKPDDTFSISGVASVITITPHVFPFEERVEMFREYINMDKSSRRMAGEVQGHGPGSVEIVIRRDHIVEDGFRQLNNLGSKLKSKIHVSFVSESGLPEAGLDYGGLSKEFLTDIAKAAFSPEYGLFSQTSTSDGLLVPNPAARFLESGISMIEFLGRIVGKALYEGILLDYSFSHVFVQKLLGRYSFLDELSTLDLELYRNLMYVKEPDANYRPESPKSTQGRQNRKLLRGGSSQIQPGSIGVETKATCERNLISPESGNTNTSPREYDDSLPIALRKGTRTCTKHPIFKYLDYGKLSSTFSLFSQTHDSISIPKDVHEAKNYPKWQAAIADEMNALIKNNTWIIIDLSLGKNPVGCRWLFTIKYDSDGTLNKYKARLVAKGYTQSYDIDYVETFAPVAKLNSIRVLFLIAVNLDWPLFQLDIKNVFLNGNLVEEIYMQLPLGYETPSTKHKVCCLKKALYGLKQSPRAWFARFTSAIKRCGYTQCSSDHTMFIKHSVGGKKSILIVYVDDIILTGDDLDEISKLKQFLGRQFETKDLGSLNFFLGMEIARNKEGMCVSQRKYILDLLKETGMLGCKPAATSAESNLKLSHDPNIWLANKDRYQKLVGKLLYLAYTCPYISFVVGLISQFMHNPNEVHMQAVFWILRYLKNNLVQGLYFKKSDYMEIDVHKDADWGGSQNDRRSTTGYCSFVWGNLVTWRSKKQNIISQSSAKAEIRALSLGICEGIWLRRILHDLRIPPSWPTRLSVIIFPLLRLLKAPYFMTRPNTSILIRPTVFLSN